MYADYMNVTHWHISINYVAAEMKAIINMDDLLKKNTFKLEVSVADNEDLTSKLQVSTAVFQINNLWIRGPFLWPQSQISENMSVCAVCVWGGGKERREQVDIYI